VVSNRGHQSITVYKVKSKGAKRGELQTVGHFHTRGETPRHFQFDHSGQYLLIANQDTDSITVFNFNLSNGELKYSGNEYRVPSPNFVCCCPSYQDDDVDIEVSSEPSRVPVFSSNASTCSDATSDSEESTVPVREGNKIDTNLEEELAQARLEIEELKRMLAAKA
jgi:DNA-binding beta-propeller fold protein YncE